MRVLIGLADTASFPSRLALALQRQGDQARVLNTEQHRYAEQNAAAASLQVLPRAFRWAAACERFGPVGRVVGGVLKTLARWAAFAYAIAWAEVVIFVGGRSLLMGNWDQWLLQRLGRTVVRVYLGSDSRPKYLGGWHPALVDDDEATVARAAKKLHGGVRRQAARVHRMDRWADVVIDSPLGGFFHQQPFVNWHAIGFPHDDSFYPAISETSSTFRPRNVDEPRVRVLHCPSNPLVKGTPQIDVAIEALVAEGQPIEYRKLTGVPRTTVLAAVRESDIVVDQLYSDTPMAGVASEAAALGTAVVVGGYSWSQLKAINPPGLFGPTVAITPEDLESTLRHLVADADARERHAAAARQFVQTQWHADAVATRLRTILSGHVDPSWWVDPASVPVWQGLAATDEHRREVLAAYVQHEGWAALNIPSESALFAAIREQVGDIDGRQSESLSAAA